MYLKFRQCWKGEEIRQIYLRLFLSANQHDKSGNQPRNSQLFHKVEREENCPKYQGFSLCRRSICPLCVRVNVCFYLLWCCERDRTKPRAVQDQANIWTGASPDVGGDISPSQSQEMTMKTMPRPTNYPGLGQAWFVHFKSSLILATVFTFLTEFQSVGVGLHTIDYFFLMQIFMSKCWWIFLFVVFL